VFWYLRRPRCASGMVLTTPGSYPYTTRAVPFMAWDTSSRTLAARELSGFQTPQNAG